MMPGQKWVAFQTIVIREIVRFTRIWLQTVLPSMITTVLYFFIFGNLIGTRIGKMGGSPYVDFIVPGRIMMAVITNSYANVVSSFYGAKFQRNVEEMLVSPMPNHVILLGFVAGGIARGLMVGAAVTAVTLVFGHVGIHHAAVVFTVVLLTAFLFSLAGFINGLFARSFDDISIVPTFVLTPLTYLGGVFYSIELLPELWRKISLLNPILYMVNAFRYGFLGVSDLNLYVSYGIMLGAIALLYGFALRLLNRGYGIRT